MSINARVELGSVSLQQQRDLGFPFSFQPYLWSVFFKIDDSRGNGTPVATVVSGAGSHGNLGERSVRAPADIAIPRSVGRWETGLRPLPRRQGTINGLVKAVVGVVAVLMEEDNVTDDGAEAGRAELVRQVRKVMDGLAADLTTALFLDVAQFEKQIRTNVENAIQDQQNVLENLWSWLDKDDFIGSVVAFSRYDDLAAGTPVPISEDWGGVFRWSVRGRMSTFTRPQPTFSRTTISFGRVRAGLVSQRGVTVENFTGRDVTLVLSRKGSQDFHLSTQSLAVPASGSASLTVRYLPGSPGTDSATVEVRHQGDDAVVVQLLLSGSSPKGPAP